VVRREAEEAFQALADEVRHTALAGLGLDLEKFV
jgi:hypothetical protein